jgi:hypothetical protein
MFDYTSAVDRQNTLIGQRSIDQSNDQFEMARAWRGQKSGLVFDLETKKCCNKSRGSTLFDSTASHSCPTRDQVVH